MRKIMIGCWVLWVIAFCMPCLILTTNNGTEEVWRGWDCCVYGWLAFLFGHFELLANLFFAGASVALMSKYKKFGFALSLASIIFASQTFFLSATKIPLDEGGVNSGHVTSFGSGFYFWYSTIILLAFVSTARLFIKPKLSHNAQT
jgi:hypothetical protein